MSEARPGRGPDAETREGEGQPTNGRPAVPPVRYGPRNGVPRGGANGSSNGSNGANGSTNGSNGSNGYGSGGRTVPAPPSPQQYRGPQPPRPSNGAGSPTGSAPASYTPPTTNGAPARPGGKPEDRQVADARTAAAARNASTARVRGGSALTPPTETSDRDSTVEQPRSGPAADETTVIPVGTGPSDDAPAAEGPGDERTLRGRLRTARGRLGARVEGPSAGPAAADTATTEARKDETPSTPPESESPAEPDVVPTTEPTEERRLTWRDRLGLPPKAPKPQPVEVPASGPGVPTAAAAAALAAGAAAGTEVPETKASPTGPTTAPEPTEPLGRVTPTSPVPAVTPDTVIIPAVDAGTVGPSSPAAAATTQALVAAKPRVGVARRTRKARLRLSRVDPWSVMKTALLFSIAAGIILVVATYGVWSVLNASGLFDAVNDMVKSVVSTPGDTTPFRIEEYVNTQKVIGVAALIAVVDVLIFTALATLGSFLYNLAATVLGGLEVTLAED